MAQQSVAFVGLGYIGLPTAVVMANNGLNVIGVDINPLLVEKVNRADLQNAEPGLKEALQEAVKSGRFRASVEMPKADAFIIAVPTPFAESHEIDVKYIMAAAEAIAPRLEGGELIVLESTSPPGTTSRLAEKIFELRPDLSADSDSTPFPPEQVIYFAHCPERILPGNALEELVENDRIIGGETRRATLRATEIYRSFCRGELLATDAPTAEMTKLTENAFRDVNIAFANELSLICDKLGINVWELIKLANHHPRVDILQPGPGVGGHCIAVDPWFIVSADPENSRLIRTARQVNDHKPEWVLEKFEEAISNSGKKKVAILGLSFKPDIDDLRESPALVIAQKMVKEHPECDFLMVEPNIDCLPDELAQFQNADFTKKIDSVQDAEILVLLVDHEEFKDPAKDLMFGKLVLDTKGIWS